jgi:hypothetical protein
MKSSVGSPPMKYGSFGRSWKRTFQSGMTTSCSTRAAETLSRLVAFRNQRC